MLSGGSGNMGRYSCSFCSNGRGIKRMTVSGIIRVRGELRFTTKRIIRACKYCYEKILGCWLSCGLGIRRGKSFVKEISKVSGMRGNKKATDALVIMQNRMEIRERRGIITP